MLCFFFFFFIVFCYYSVSVTVFYFLANGQCVKIGDACIAVSGISSENRKAEKRTGGSERTVLLVEICIKVEKS